MSHPSGTAGQKARNPACHGYEEINRNAYE